MSTEGKRGVSDRESRRTLLSRVLSVVFVLLLTISAFFLVLPSVSRRIGMMNQEEVISSYEDKAQGSEEKKVAAEKRAVREYNRGIAEADRQKTFQYRGASATDPQYERLMSGPDGVMGYIEIPKIRVDLPIAHGTTQQTLEKMAGHMYGTSLPSGGTDTHAVIAAHTGLSGEELFTHLTRMKEGDVFYLHVWGETHAYQVVRIVTVLPQQESLYLQVEPGRDLVTLYTCTPFGINDHRLLVCGERREDLDPKKTGSGGGSTRIRHRSRGLLLQVILWLMLPAAVPLTALVCHIAHARKRKNE